MSQVARIPWILSERNTRSCFSPPSEIRARAWLVRHADSTISNSHSGDEYSAGRFGAAKRAVIFNAMPFDEIAEEWDDIDERVLGVEPEGETELAS